MDGVPLLGLLVDIRLLTSPGWGEIAFPACSFLASLRLCDRATSILLAILCRSLASVCAYCHLGFVYEHNEAHLSTGTRLP